MVGVGWRGGSGWDSDNAATHRELRRELREGGGGLHTRAGPAARKRTWTVRAFRCGGAVEAGPGKGSPSPHPFGQSSTWLAERTKMTWEGLPINLANH